VALIDKKRIFVSAGDISGDIHAAGLIARCRKERPDIVWSGLGGAAMNAAGCRLLGAPESDPIIGFRKVAARIPGYLLLLARIHRHLEEEKPALAVLTDYPGLNLQIARLASMLSIPVLYFICPQYWAWAPWRIKKFARLVDKALVIFPFEKEYFSSHGVDATWIGHPVFDRPEVAKEKDRDIPLSLGGDLLGLLPGSRRHELEANLPVMLKIASRLKKDFPRLVPVIAHNDRGRLELAENLAASREITVRTFEGDIFQAARACRLCIVASGTATLEVALTGTPLIALYRVPPLAKKLASLMLTVPWFCQVNLMAGSETVPEFLLDNDDPSPVIPECLALAGDTPERREMIKRLARFRKKHFKPGSLDRAAKEVLNHESLSR